MLQSRRKCAAVYEDIRRRKLSGRAADSTSMKVEAEAVKFFLKNAATRWSKVRILPAAPKPFGT